MRISLERVPFMRRLAAALVLFGATFAGTPGAAQRIQGEVVDMATRQAVPGALVTLSDTSGTVVRQAAAGADGRFALDNLPTGPLRVDVEALGYASSAARRVNFDGQPLFLDIGLEPAPVGVEGIRVSVTPQQPHLRANGFYDRLRRGHGDFVTEDDIARLRPARSSEILRRVSSISLDRGEPVIRRGGVGLSSGSDCAPSVYVDGMAVRFATSVRRGPYTGLSGPHALNAFDNVVPPPEAIQAVEIYPGGASIPARWRGTGSACGVIVVWTKH